MQLVSEPFCYQLKDVMRLTWFQVDKILQSSAKKNQKNEDKKEGSIPTLEEFISGLKREHPNRTQQEWYSMYSKYIKKLGK